MQSVNEIAVSYAKVISSIEHATSELKDVTESFNGLFQELFFIYMHFLYPSILTIVLSWNILEQSC